MAESLEEKIKRVMAEKIIIVPYDPSWPAAFEKEKAYLLSVLPPNLITRWEHFGSTAIPGMAAKPIIDILGETPSLEKIKVEVPPVLEKLGYDYFWRPTFGDDGQPFYAWFIKRDQNGKRSHHIHIVENNKIFKGHWDRLLFRDYLIRHPELAAEYAALKYSLLKDYKDDRVAYTRHKGTFIQSIMERIYRNE